MNTLRRWIAISLLITLFCACRITSVRLPETDPSALESRLRGSNVSVDSNGERAGQVADLLRATGIFGQVAVGLEDPDLIVIPTQVAGPNGCGMPLITTYYTLGLIPSFTRGYLQLNLEFKSARSSDTVIFREDYEVKTAHGLWAFFMRVSPRWRRYGDGLLLKDYAADFQADLEPIHPDLASLLSASPSN